MPKLAPSPRDAIENNCEYAGCQDPAVVSLHTCARLGWPRFNLCLDHENHIRAAMAAPFDEQRYIRRQSGPAGRQQVSVAKLGDPWSDGGPTYAARSAQSPQ